MSKFWDSMNKISGFKEYTDPKGNYHRGKTLWDLLQLLIVPGILVLGAWRLSSWSSQSQAQTAKEEFYEGRLQSYLEKMDSYLLENNLIPENGQSVIIQQNQEFSVADLAQVQTVTALRSLNTTRQDIIFQFIRDTGLSEFLLVDASMRGINLRYANMGRIDLSRSDFTNADLRTASLSQANLTEADLKQANLSGAYLLQTNLTRANLSGADLSDADLTDADLTGANMTGAIISEEQLAVVKSLSQTIMPDGRLHE